jgi:hypothetical protein
MIEFVKDFYKLLSSYKLRGYDINQEELFAIPLSWIFLFVFACLVS